MTPRRGKRGTTRTVGYGYVGRWCDDTLGWSMPGHLSEDTGRTTVQSDRGWSKHHPHYLCRITVELVTNKNGHPIVRYPGGKKKP